jgi:PPP family 3-phenylpropionic acid transporter
MESKARDPAAIYLCVLSATLFMPIGLHLPYFPVWLAARGLSDGEIVTVLATPMVMRVVMTPVIATFADRCGIALMLALCASTMAVGYCVLAFLEGFSPILIGAVVVTTAMGVMPSLADALTLTEIRRIEMAGLRRVVYGHVRVWTSIGVLSTMLLSGRIVALFPGDRIVIALAGLAFIAAAAACAAAVQFRTANVSFSVKGRLTADSARLRLAAVCIAAASLILASHAEVYSFGTLNWRQAGLSPDFISVAWAIGVATEGLLFLANARYFGTGKNAIAFLCLGGAGAAFRWFWMSGDPGPWFLLVLQAMHGLSFAATYCGAVLLLGTLAGPTHRARMQGWFAASTALSLAASTFACGFLTGRYGQGAYLFMMALALAGCGLALFAGFLDRNLPSHRPDDDLKTYSAAERFRSIGSDA